MNKKVFYLTATFASIGVVAASLSALSAKAPFIALGGEDNHNHTVIFTGENVASGAYDEESYAQPFSLSKTGAIVVSDTEKYDIASYDFDPDIYDGTYAYAAEGAVTFGTDGAIATIESCKSEIINITFALVEYANVDDGKSVVSYTVNGEYENVAFELKDYDDDFWYYGAAVNTSSHYGAKVQITQVKLVFSC